MRITKYIHSCLLFEEGKEKLLCDPGKFSFVEGLVKPEIFRDVATIFVTHPHPDHVDVEAVKQIVALSGATVVANSQVAAKLHEQAVTVLELEEGSRQFGSFTLRAVPAQHAAILSDELPQNTAFLINERILNPGDSFNPSLLEFQGIELLILPVMAPWLTELAVADFATKMKPKQVLPVHDGYAKAFFLKQRYENYEAYFAKLNIKFLPLAEPGASITL